MLQILYPSVFVAMTLVVRRQRLRHGYVAAGEIRKSSNGRGGRGNEQRLRAATVAEEGATITVVDRGIAIIAAESTVSEKGNNAAGDVVAAESAVTGKGNVRLVVVGSGKGEDASSEGTSVVGRGGDDDAVEEASTSTFRAVEATTMVPR
ncbi:hypothetical protein BHE74_00025646 [Ensete ventricosum]|nr:hypothetical protein BHE74_00025646 [Ensete ventricosum]